MRGKAKRWTVSSTATPARAARPAPGAGGQPTSNAPSSRSCAGSGPPLRRPPRAVDDVPHEAKLRIHLVVEVERIGPVAKDRSSVVTALIRAFRAKPLLWVGTDIKQTAYRVVSIEEEVTADAR